MARSSSNGVEEILGQERWTAEDAHAVLAAVSRSGLTLSAFATRHGVRPWRLYRWKRVLGREGVTAEPVSFEELRVAEPAPERPRQDEGMEVELPSGHVVRLGSGFDEGALRRLLLVLGEAGGC